MNAGQYMWIGSLLGGIAGVCCMTAIILSFTTRRKRYRYMRRFWKLKFPETFYQDMRMHYRNTEEIGMMLQLLLDQYPKGRVASRIKASQDYLKNSHYKDYETALYRYLSDSDTDHIITEILQADLQKFRRLPCKLVN